MDLSDLSTKAVFWFAGSTALDSDLSLLPQVHLPVHAATTAELLGHSRSQTGAFV